MQKHFSFGHTIVPKEEQGSSEQEESNDLLGLFRIGQQQIAIPKKKEEVSGQEEEDSDRTVRQKKERKEKKVKKEKKEKKEKKQKKEKKEKHKQKKEKNEKKGKRDRSLSPQYQGDQQLVLYDNPRKAQLLEKYAKILDGKTLDEKLAQKFDLNIKLGEGALHVDIIQFPEHRLYQYGPMDKEIPRYQRLPNFEMIVGFKKSKHRKARKIIRELNRIINQRNLNPDDDQISVNRYFHFQGYDQVGLERLATDQKALPDQAVLRFNLQEAAAGSEEEAVLKLTREYNKRINESPKDIDLWVEFITLQDKFSLSVGTLKNRAAVLDRKLSIIEKALHLNPNNERLGLLCLGCLFERQVDHQQIAGKCLELIRENPSSVGLWKFYFSLRIERFSSYSHAHLRKTFEEMSEMLRKAIEKTKSAVEIWKIRKAALEVTRSMLQVYKLEGYGELATGIIVALLEYNLFMPDQVARLARTEEKLQLFQQYWEDCQAFKLGETNRGSSWSNMVTTCADNEFIGDYDCPDESKEKLAGMREVRRSEKGWRMLNANKDQRAIESEPQSFILYEDVEFAMMLYRDGESMTGLVDALADHLELPLVFSATTAYHQFSFQLVDRTLKRAINHPDSRLDYPTLHNCGYFWARYWNPAHTACIIPHHNLAKIEYLRRVLVAVKEKLPSHKTAINEYLSFVACAAYLSPQVQGALHLSEAQSLQQLSEILQDEPLNLGTWSMYIEASFAKGQTQEECLQCFLELFGTATTILRSQEELNRVHLEILFWMTEFCRTHRLGQGRLLLKIFKKIVFVEADEPFTRSEYANGFDCLQLEQYFRKECQKSGARVLSKDGKQSVISRCAGLIFMMFYLQEFPESGVQELAEKGTLLLLGELDTAGSSNSNFFIIKFLTSFKLITHAHIAAYHLLKLFPFTPLAEYWVMSSRKPLVLLLAEWEACEERQLALWMTISVFLFRSRAGQAQMREYFYLVGKKLCFEDRLEDQRAEFMGLLNELLAYDVEDHTKFIMYSLHHVPFSKKLYILNLLLASDPTEKRKLAAILQEKSIRVLDQSILE